MSALSLRRSTDRGGGGGGGVAPIKPTTTSQPKKPLTPVSKQSISNGSGDSIKRSTGKENPRATSRIRAAAAASVKPVIRPVPRIEKVVVNSDVRFVRSSSRGSRSSSPYEFNRGLSDLSSKPRVLDSDKRKLLGNVQEKKGLLSDLKCKVQEKKGAFRDSNAKVSGNSDIMKRDLKESRSLVRGVASLLKSDDFDDNDTRLKSKERSCSMNRGWDGDVDKSVNSGLESSKVVSSGVRGTEIYKGRPSVGTRSSEVNEKGVKELKRNSCGRLSSLEISKGKCGSEEVMTLSGTKYPSKLHEKLAFLEGKVKRIASDIKRTKEILDSNNTDASKVIITDIQQKISGIEKVMGNVVISEPDIGIVNRAGEANQLTNGVGMSQDGKDNVKCLIRGQNNEELEARLFPHHKLLRDRTSLQTAGGGLLSSSQIGNPKVEDASKLEEKVSSPIDEKPVKLEVLSSQKDEQSNDTSKRDNWNSDYRSVKGIDGAGYSNAQNTVSGERSAELVLTTSETIDEFDDEENMPAMIIDEENEENGQNQLTEIGHKSTTAGWFVSDGESVLLAHNDNSCAFYDIAHCEEKAEYRPPVGIPPSVWRDCWIVRAPNADGCSEKFVVAASAGNTIDSGFCSWDFYSKEVKVVHIEDGTPNSRTALAPLPNNTLYRRNALSSFMAAENQQWWYKPSGPLIMSTASHQRVVKVYDIRDGEQIMKWELQKPVVAMEYSSPLQWRNRGKVVIAEAENISLWDVNSQHPQSLVSVSSFGRKILALHVNNTDAEVGGGVRQRVSSSEAEGNDGVFCTTDFINILDFRHPSGVGLKIPKLGANAQSVFSRGDSIYIGCTDLKSSAKKPSCPQVQQFSIRGQRLVSTYSLPESNGYTAMTQVWGKSNLVMGVCGLGLFAFDAIDDQMQFGSKAREVIGLNDMLSPSFDYVGPRVLLVSRDRPAMWRYLL